MDFQAVLHNGPIDRTNETTRAALPGVLDPWMGRNMTERRLTSGMGGYGSYTGRLWVSPREQQRWLRRLNYYVAGYIRGATLFEGRLEQPVQEGLSLQIRCMGYISSLEDDGFKYKAAKGTDAAQLAREIVQQFAPMLHPDESYISSTGLTMAAETFDGSESPMAVLQGVLDASAEGKPRPFYAMVREGRRLSLRGQENSIVSWRIPISSLAEVPHFGRDLMQVYTSVQVKYDAEIPTDKGGTKRQSQIFGPLDRGDFLEEIKTRRLLTVSGGKLAGNQSSINDQARAIAQSALDRLSQGSQPFSLDVIGPCVNAWGSWAEPVFMFGGQLATLDYPPGDERIQRDGYNTFLITATDSDLETGVTRIDLTPLAKDQLDLTRWVPGTSFQQRVAG